MSSKTIQPSAANSRLAKLIGANVVLVGIGDNNALDVLSQLRSSHVQLFVIDDERAIGSRKAHVMEYARLIIVPFSTCSDPVQSSIESIAQLGHNIDLVTTYAENYVCIAARIAAALGLPANPVEACDTVRNKMLTRQAMKDARLPTPLFVPIQSPEDIDRAVKHMKFPAVLKPQMGKDSLGVIRCDDPKAVEKAYAKISASGYEGKFPSINNALLEEMYQGDEFDIDIIMQNGEVLFCEVTDNFFPMEPWFQETGASAPSCYPKSKQNELGELAVASVKAVGLCTGAFHVECKYTQDGPRVIEINGRMGGGPVHKIVKHVWGVDLITEHCVALLNTGGGALPVVPTRQSTSIALMEVNAPVSGRLWTGHMLEHLRRMSDKVEITYYKSEGSDVIGAAEGVPDRIASVLVYGEGGANVLETVAKCVDRIRVEIHSGRDVVSLPIFFPLERYPFVVAKP